MTTPFNRVRPRNHSAVRSPKIEVGEYTYYDDPDAPEDFERKAVLYR